MMSPSKRSAMFMAAIWVVSLAAATAQQGVPPGEKDGTGRSGDLEQQIVELRQLISELRSETASYREEVLRLQDQLRTAVAQHSASAEQPGNAVSTTAPAVAPELNGQETPRRLNKLEDDLRLLAGKVDDQYQTKVESGSKYRLRLSGIALFNAFSNRGAVDNVDVPQHAAPPGLFGESGSIGGSLRQSQIGLEVFGPEWRGARIDANVRFDFSGGFPDTTNGVLFGLPRLRTGTINLRWKDTTIVAGQDAPFISALSPTSLASLAEPAFSYAGNLWYWTPQVRVEHRFEAGDLGSGVLTAGLLDPLTGDIPQQQFDRTPQAGETSRSPAYAARVGWARGKDDAFSIGAGGYFSPQRWGFDRKVDGWAATLDWQVPLGPRFAVSGELYRGMAIGGLGAAGGHSILSSDVLNNSNAVVHGLDTLGGWSQLKFRASSKLEFNSGYGQDNPFSRELRRYAAVQARLDPEIGINRDLLVNSIYRPRSNLLLSLEYRHFYSARLLSARRTAEHVDAAIGVLF